MEQSEVEVAWAAGIFEGEGTMHISKSWRQPIVSITSTDLDVIEKFANIVGVGNFYARKDNRKESYKIAYKWQIQSRNDVIKVLELLMPYLCQRRVEKARELLARAYEMRDSSFDSELLISLGLKTRDNK